MLLLLAHSSPTRIGTKYWMRANDFIRLSERPLNTYAVKIKLKQHGYTNIIDTQVQARTPEMARRILRTQYNNKNVVVGQPRELRAK